MSREDTIEFKGLWKEQQEILARRYPFLKKEELKFRPGNSRLILENLKTRLGLSNAELLELLKNLEDK